jgi:predicted enzyme related to lactoylglutathione lyase
MMECGMNTKLYRVIIQVSDIEAAVNFYGQLFEQGGERVSSGRHYFNCGGVILACVDPAADSDDHVSRSNPDHVYLAVSDLETLFERIQRLACEWLEPAIEIRPWGERSFYAKDPFGNPLCFVDESTVFSGGLFEA